MQNHSGRCHVCWEGLESLSFGLNGHGISWLRSLQHQKSNKWPTCHAVWKLVDTMLNLAHRTPTIWHSKKVQRLKTSPTTLIELAEHLKKDSYGAHTCNIHQRLRLRFTDVKPCSCFVSKYVLLYKVMIWCHVCIPVDALHFQVPKIRDGTRSDWCLIHWECNI